MIAMEKHEEALAKKYGFDVSEDGTGHYVVRDPSLPKRKKFVGGNLYSLMLAAIEERNRLKIKPQEESTNVVSPNFGKKKERLVPAPPPPQKGTKLYLIKKILLVNSKSTVEEIAKTLESDGFTASPSTISTVRSDFLHSIRVIKEMNRWRDC
jgi:hypothetical protein